MSSIFGIVARSEPGKQNALLTHMLAAAPNSAGQASDQQASAQAGLAATRRGAQGGMARSGTHWLAFAGHIIEDEDYQARLRLLTVVTPEGFCERLLALYLCLGVEGLQSLNGQYAVAVWDERTQRMLLVNDRYGLQPFYYWRGPHELVFGSQIKAIAAHKAFKRQVNPLGLADLLATGQMMGEHTLYAGVKALPPATRMLFEAGYLAMETYTRLPFYAPGWADHEPKQAV
jgi:asparagine synthase (glutamine-hydrolysing)